MSLYDDLQSAMVGALLPTAGHRQEEIDVLRRRVTQLERTIAHLLTVIEHTDGIDKDHLRTRLLAIVRGADADEADADDAARVAQTAYRGAAPSGQDDQHCAVCRAPLDPTDPEMFLEKGRVCGRCYRSAPA